MLEKIATVKLCITVLLCKIDQIPKVLRWQIVQKIFVLFVETNIVYHMVQKIYCAILMLEPVLFKLKQSTGASKRDK